MSLNIETTSDKPNFINYFSDPLILPQNSQVVLTKTNVSVPIIVSPSVKMPEIDLADRGHTAIQVGIDGVVVNITWTDLYTSANWFFANNYGLDRLNTPVDFFGFGGDNYYFMPNQQIIMNCENDALNAAGDSKKMKVSFNQVLAKALDDKFLFYEVEPAPTHRKTEGVSYFDDNNVITPLIDGAGARIPGTVLDYSDNILEEIGFNIAYDPNQTTIETPTDFNWSAASSLTNFTRTDATTITSAIAGVNVAFATQHGTPFSIDPNGGWVGTVPTLVGGTMAYGLSLSSEFGGWDNNFLSGGGTTCDDYLNLIDIGFKFKANDNGTTTVQVIDGKTDNASYDGGTTLLPQIPLTEPPHLVSRATAGEKFFIHIKRGSIVNGTTEFIFSLFSGTATILDPTDNLIYVCKRTFGGSIRPTLVVLSDNVLGNIFSGWNHIPITTQSLEQGNYFNTTPYGGTSNRSVYLEPKFTGLSDDTDIKHITNFWRAWGLISNENAVIPTADQRRYFTNKSIGTHLLRTFKNPVNLQNSSFLITYMIGQDAISKLWKANGQQLMLNTDYSVSNLPSVLHIAIDNLDLKNFNGTMLGGIGTIGSNQPTGQRPSVDRVIGSIPLPINDILESDNYLLQYEPLNLIYRPINNPNNFTLNQLQISIFYYDFRTNLRQNLEVINGICNLELNIRQGYTPKKPNNELLPY